MTIQSRIVRGIGGGALAVAMLGLNGVPDTPIHPGAGTIAITGYAPDVAQTASMEIIPFAGMFTLTGYAPDVAQGGLVLDQYDHLQFIHHKGRR